MRKMKPSGKRSFLRNILRALGINRDSALPLPSQAETQLGVSMSYTSHAIKRTALQEAEQAKARAIMHFRRKQFL